tara:strand:- start:118 stop:903 length:786 start_codon:yes stop_codon:yes gene_type:complete
MNTLDTTLFPVEEIPAIGTTGLGKAHNPITNTGYKFIVREDTGQVISCMTNEYNLIKNEQVIDIASPIMNKYDAELKEVRTFSEGARSQWTWNFPNSTVDIGGGDFVNPTVTIRNSYDGSLEASAIAGAFRLVCSNGMVIGIVLGRSSVKHSIWTKDVDFEKIISSVVKKTGAIFTKDFPLLAETKVKTEDIASVIKMFPEQYTDTVVNYMLGNEISTYWDLLNAATWVATHNMKRKVEATHKFESMLYPKLSGMAKAAIA